MLCTLQFKLDSTSLKLMFLGLVFCPLLNYVVVVVGGLDSTGGGGSTSGNSGGGGELVFGSGGGVFSLFLLFNKFSNTVSHNRW